MGRGGRTDGRMDGWTDGRMDGQIPPVFYWTLSPSGPLPKKLIIREFNKFAHRLRLSTSFMTRYQQFPTLTAKNAMITPRHVSDDDNDDNDDDDDDLTTNDDEKVKKVNDDDVVEKRNNAQKV